MQHIPHFFGESFNVALQKHAWNLYSNYTHFNHVYECCPKVFIVDVQVFARTEGCTKI